MSEPICLQAIFNKATTTIDGAWRLTFDTYDYMSEEVTKIAKLRGEALYVVIMTEKQYHEGKKNV